MKRFPQSLLAICLLSGGLISFPQAAGASDGASAPKSTVVSGSFNSCLISETGLLRCWGSNKYKQNNVPSDLGPVHKLAVGFSHSCAITSSGSVRCWGSNEGGETDVPNDLGNVTQISAGVMHTCVVTDIGSVRCWGDDPLKRLTKVPSDLGGVAQLSAGSYHTCSVDQVGSVSCWGTNWYGQNNVPLALEPVKQIASGYAHTCALTVSGQVSCWGANEGGETDVPEDLDAATQISAGAGHTCVVTELGAVRCWGDDPINRLTKIPNDLGRVDQISAGAYHTCAVTESNMVRCWGTNWYGQNNVPSDLAGGNSSTPLITNPCSLNTVNLDLAGSNSSYPAGPSLSGKPTVGQTLRATNGSWPAGTKLCAFWIVGERIAIASKSGSYRIQAADLGSEIRYAVVGTLNGDSSLKLSNPIVVVESTFTRPTTPIVKNAAMVGTRLIATNPNWEAGTSYTFQWFRDGQAIVGANSISYVPRADEIGSRLSLQICGFKQLFSSLCLASAEQVVQPGTLAKIGTVLFFGKISNVGATLTGATTAWQPGVSLSSQWLLDGVPIPGATSKQLIVLSSFRGKVLTYQVTGTLNGYQTVVKSSVGKIIP